MFSFADLDLLKDFSLYSVDKVIKCKKSDNGLISIEVHRQSTTPA